MRLLNPLQFYVRKAFEFPLVSCPSTLPCHEKMIRGSTIILSTDFVSGIGHSRRISSVSSSKHDVGFKSYVETTNVVV